MKLAAGICFYEDVKSLERTLDSLDGVDEIIAIDGKFTECAGNDVSADGSRELVLQYANQLFTYSGSEVNKRNLMLEISERLKVDYLLIIDSDEFVQDGADWKEFRRNCQRVCNDSDNIYGVRYIRHGGGGLDIIPRLWYKPGDMVYEGNHNIFKNKHTGQIQQSAPNKAVIEGITLDGNDDLRSAEYIKRVYDYQVKLIKSEKDRAIKMGFQRPKHY